MTEQTKSKAAAAALAGARTVIVCSECLRACCWYGEFMCDEAQKAGTVEKTVDELRVLGLEHERFWVLGPVGDGVEMTEDPPNSGLYSNQPIPGGPADKSRKG